MKITHVKTTEAQLAEGIARFMPEEYAKMLAGLDTMIREGGGKGSVRLFSRLRGGAKGVGGICGLGSEERGPEEKTGLRSQKG
jgi:hypothetical protein